MTVAYAEKLAGDVRKKTGVAGFHWHKSRHTYGRRLAEQKVLVQKTALYLGHDDIRTTMIYYTLDPSEAIDSFFQDNIKLFPDKARKEGTDKRDADKVEHA